MRNRLWFVVPIVSYFCVIGSGLWMEHGSEVLYSKIEPFLDASISLVFCAHIFALLYILHKHRVTKLKDQLNDKAAMFFNIYHELSTFKKIDTLRNALDKFIAKESYVHAVQLYRYNVKYHGDKVTFKINHVDGSVNELIPMNAMMQIYYNIDRKIYKDFLKAKIEFDNENPFEMIEFIHRYNYDLSVRQINTPTDNDYHQYAFIELCEDILNNVFDIQLETYLDPDKVRLLTDNQRTGILRGILIKDHFYSFSHSKPGEKYGRVYLTKHFNHEIDGNNHIFIITLDSSVKDLSVPYDYLADLQERFNKTLEDDGVMGYNKGDRVGGGEIDDSNSQSA